MDEDVLARIRKIEERLDVLERMVKVLGTSSDRSTIQSISMKDLLALPSSLQKTVQVIQELGEATSPEVSKETGRDRTVETIYLNQLTRLGYLTKERRAHKIYFKVLRYF